MAEFKGDDNDWPTTSEDYQLQILVGQGAFAKVWKAWCVSKQQIVAVKIMELENVSSSFDDIRQEVQTMRLADNDNVIHCYCSFVHETQLWLVMQFMDKGSCLHIMNVARKNGCGEGLREDCLANILHQTLLGLNYFHNQGQIHRDIKAGNILLSSEGEVRIADFGVAGWMITDGEKRNTAKTFVGTPCWMAPEVMEQNTGYNEKADIWSFGITALELAKGYAPYAQFPPMKVLLMTIQEGPPSLRNYDDENQSNGEPFSRGFKDILRLCLQKDPKKRPSCQTLLSNKFFKQAPGPEALIEFLNTIGGVSEGQQETSISDRPPGTRPAFVYKGTVEEDDNKKAPSNQHAPGTTWVFDDGSRVLLPSKSAEDETNAGNTIDELEEQFKSFSYGEHNKKATDEANDQT